MLECFLHNCDHEVSCNSDHECNFCNDDRNFICYNHFSMKFDNELFMKLQINLVTTEIILDFLFPIQFLLRRKKFVTLFGIEPLNFIVIC